MYRVVDEGAFGCRSEDKNRNDSGGKDDNDGDGGFLSAGESPCLPVDKPENWEREEKR